MRISDWSSDVCSSDLPVNKAGLRGTNDRSNRASTFAQLAFAIKMQLRSTLGNSGETRCWMNSKPLLRAAMRSEERRVGKSVSVRVDLGGRRIIKKNKKTTKQHEKHEYQTKAK